MKCDLCKRIVELPFTCNYCGQHFCSDHRLPEQHLCPGISKKSWAGRRKKEILKGIAHERVPGQIREKERVHRRTKKRTRSIVVACILLIIIGIAYSAYVQYGLSMDDLGMDAHGFWEGASYKCREILGGIGQMFSDLIPEPELESEPLKSFTSVDDLVRFLDNDNVSDVVYASDFVCGDFAEALVDRAHDAGYDLKVYSMFGSQLDDFIRYVESLEYVRYVEIEGGVTVIITTFNYGYGAGHAVCKTRIGSEIYLIEPQSDQVFKTVGSGYEVVYFGEVTKEG